MTGASDGAICHTPCPEVPQTRPLLPGGGAFGCVGHRSLVNQHSGGHHLAPTPPTAHNPPGLLHIPGGCSKDRRTMKPSSPAAPAAQSPTGVPQEQASERSHHTPAAHAFPTPCLQGDLREGGVCSHPGRHCPLQMEATSGQLSPFLKHHLGELPEAVGDHSSEFQDIRVRAPVLTQLGQADPLLRSRKVATARLHATRSAFSAGCPTPESPRDNTEGNWREKSCHLPPLTCWSQSTLRRSNTPGPTESERGRRTTESELAWAGVGEGRGLTTGLMGPCRGTQGHPSAQGSLEDCLDARSLPDRASQWGRAQSWNRSPCSQVVLSLQGSLPVPQWAGRASVPGRDTGHSAPAVPTACFRMGPGATWPAQSRPWWALSLTLSQPFPQLQQVGTQSRSPQLPNSL